MKILMAFAVLMLIAGIVLSDVILGVLAAVSLACAAVDALASRHPARQPVHA